MPDPREQEQSIKDRKKLLYDDDDPIISASAIERKPFTLHLRETAPLPVPPLIKATLWATAIVVGLLLLGAMWKSVQTKVKESPNTGMTQAPLNRGA